jgi:hypothetical protein
MFLQRGDERRAADDDAGLRPAEQLVAREGHQPGPGGHALLDHRLFGETIDGGVEQRARAQVVHDRQPVGVRRLDQLGQLGRVGKSEHQKIAGMDAQQERGALGDGGGVVGRVGPIGRADLDQADARLAHHVRDAEAAPDLDQLATRDDRLLALAQRRQHQQHGGGVVVDHQRGFGARQAAQQIGDQLVARAALAGLQVVFQVGVARGGRLRRVQGGRAERGPAQVGVDHHPGGVDDRPQRRTRRAPNAVGHQPGQVGHAVLPSAVAQGAARVVEHLARHLDHQLARQRAQERVLDQAIDARQLARGRAHPSAGDSRARGATQLSEVMGAREAGGMPGMPPVGGPPAPGGGPPGPGFSRLISGPTICIEKAPS